MTYDFGNYSTLNVRTATGFVPVKALEVTFRRWPGRTYYLHTDPVARERWALSEGRTGLAVVMDCATWQTALDEAFQKLREHFDEFLKVIDYLLTPVEA